MRGIAVATIVASTATMKVPAMIEASTTRRLGWSAVRVVPGEAGSVMLVMQSLDLEVDYALPCGQRSSADVGIKRKQASGLYGMAFRLARGS